MGVKLTPFQFRLKKVTVLQITAKDKVQITRTNEFGKAV